MAKKAINAKQIAIDKKSDIGCIYSAFLFNLWADSLGQIAVLNKIRSISDKCRIYRAKLGQNDKRDWFQLISDYECSKSH